MENRPSGRTLTAYALFLVAVCGVAYANSTTGTFTYDDKAIIRDNPRIRSPGKLGEILSTSYFGGPPRTGTAYRPVLLLTYAVQWWIHGKNAMAFHIVNVILHAGATVMLGALLLRCGIDRARSALASLFFAVAPIHVEAVASLVGRGETLAALFTLGYLHLALGTSRDATARRRWVWIPAALLLYGAGVLTKESAAVAPALLLLLLAFRAPGGLAGRIGAALRAGWIVFAGSAAVLAGTFLLRAQVLGGWLRAPGWGIFEVENPLAPLRRLARVVNACAILLRYAGRTIVPLHLSADESAWSIRPLPVLSVPGLAAAALLLLIVLLAVARFSSGSPAALGVLFFGIAFLPTANLLYPIGTIFGERIAYLPSAGLCLVLASAIAGPASSLAALGVGRRRAAAAIALLFAGRTVMRNAVWWTDSSLFASCLADAPDSAKAHYNWAYVRAEAQAREEALRHYTRAVELYALYWDAWSGKGKMEKELGRLPEAEHSYSRALEANDSSEVGYFGLGQVYEDEDRLAEAEADYRRGLAKIPNSLPLAFRLATVLSDEDSPEADAAWQRALRISPVSAPSHADYADWLLDQGRDREAVLQAREALRLDPRSFSALRVLARRPYAEGSLAAALALERACRASREQEDLDALAEVARRNPAYRPRFERVRPQLARGIAREEAAASGARSLPSSLAP